MIKKSSSKLSFFLSQINLEDGDLVIPLLWAGAVFLLFYVAFPLPEFVSTLWFGAKFTHFLFAFALASVGFLFCLGGMMIPNMGAKKEK